MLVGLATNLAERLEFIDDAGETAAAEERDLGKLRHTHAAAADRQLEENLVLDERHAVFRAEKRVELARHASVHGKETGPGALLLLAQSARPRVRHGRRIYGSFVKELFVQPSRHLRPRNGDPQPTTAVELLFDLVYAFAVTQISHLLIGRLTYTSVAHAALLLWVVWWAWIYTTWMVNWFEPASSPVRLVVVFGALASLLMAAAIPTAFTATPLLFAAAYVVLQVGRNAAARWLLEDDHALRVVFERILVWSLLSAVFWITGALAPSSWRFALWGAALLIDFVAPIVGYWTPGRGRSGTTDYPVDGGHFAERFQSFIIIVLGESIIVTGAAASARGLSSSSAFALAIAFLITGGLWWLYFGVVAENSKQHIANAEDPAVLARDAYTYLHLPIVAGVIMVAVGDDFLVSDANASLSTAGLIMLVGGPALFLAGENAFRLRMIGSIGSKRAVAVATLCLAGVAVRDLPALAVGAIVAGLITLLALWEAAGTTNGLKAGSLRRVRAPATPGQPRRAKR